MRLIDGDELKEQFKDKEGDDFTAFHFYDVIDKMPTIEEHKTGKWEVAEKYNSNGFRTICVCNQCRDFYTDDSDEMNYCPHCGAKMEGAEE